MAHDVASLAAALEADGRENVSTVFPCPDCDGRGEVILTDGASFPCETCEETGEVDAVAVLAEAERRARKSGRTTGRWQVVDHRGMTGADLAAIGTTAAATASRGRRLPDGDFTELEAAALAAVAERGAEADRERPRRRARDGAAVARMLRWMDRAALMAPGMAETLPRWSDAAYTDGRAAEVAAAARGRRLTDGEAREARRLWTAVAVGAARSCLRDLTAEWMARDTLLLQGADARRLLTASRAAEADVSAVADALALAGRPLTERQSYALMAAVLTDPASGKPMDARQRADLANAAAEADGRTPTATPNGERQKDFKGREAAARRWATEAALAGDIRAAAREADGHVGYWRDGCYHAGADHARHAATGRERAALAALRFIAAGRPSGRRKLTPWPVREAACDGGPTGHVPTATRGSGKGHRPAATGTPVPTWPAAVWATLRHATPVRPADLAHVAALPREAAPVARLNVRPRDWEAVPIPARPTADGHGQTDLERARTFLKDARSREAAAAWAVDPITALEAAATLRAYAARWGIDTPRDRERVAASIERERDRAEALAAALAA